MKINKSSETYKTVHRLSPVKASKIRRDSVRSSRSRNLLSGKVLLIKVKLRSSSFVRGAFVVQVNPIKFEEFGGNMADVQNAAI